MNNNALKFLTDTGVLVPVIVEVWLSSFQEEELEPISSKMTEEWIFVCEMKHHQRMYLQVMSSF